MSALRHKYGAIRDERDGRKFASRAEARYYDMLKLRLASGEVVMFLPQVAFPLPGGTKYVCDFMEFHADGTVHVVDVKGMETPAFKAKKKQVEALYPVTIEVVRA